MKKFIIALLLIFVLAVMGYTIYLKFFGDKTTNFLVIDINPSVQLGLDDNNVVTSVTPLNNDADVLLSDLNLVGMDATEASSTVVNTAVEMGYISEYSDTNTVNVQSTIDDTTTREQLQTKIADRINNDLNGRAIVALILAGGLTDEMKAKADQYNISYGKYLLVSKALKLNASLSEATVANMSVQEIQTQIKNAVEERHNDIAADAQEMKTMLITEKERIKNEYKQKIEDLKTTLLEKYKEEKATGTLTEAQKEALKQQLLEQRKEAIKTYVQEVKDKIQSIKENSTTNTGTTAAGSTTTGTSSTTTSDTTTNSTINNVSPSTVEKIREEVRNTMED